MTVSVALTTYNGKRFLLEQLESIANQTHLPDEVVIADDLSTDDTVSIIKSFSVGAPFRVKLHMNVERLGWARNFVQVARLCSAELIAFCDQDDVWSPTKLERCLAEFSRPEVYLVYHDAETVDSSLVPYGYLRRLPLASREGAALELPPFRNPYGFSMIFRRRLLNFCGLHELSLDPDRAGQPMAHDQFFFFLATALARVRYVGESLVKYRQHGANVVGPGVRMPLSYRLRGITEAECALRSLAARNRAQILRQMTALATERENCDLERLRVLYLDLAERYRLREIVHGKDALRTRLGALARLGSSAYGSDPWGFGWKAFIKDGFAALGTSQSALMEPPRKLVLRRLKGFFASLARAIRR